MIAVSTELALSELLLSGCTTASDHHYLFPSQLESAIDIQVEEAKKLGMRVVLTRGSMSLGEKDGGLPPQSVVQTKEQILSDSERLIKTHHDNSDGAMTQIALAPCSPFSVSTDLMIETAQLAKEHNGSKDIFWPWYCSNGFLNCSVDFDYFIFSNAFIN